MGLPARWPDIYGIAVRIPLPASQLAQPTVLVAGLPGALWSASGYVGTFGRPMNRIYNLVG